MLSIRFSIFGRLVDIVGDGRHWRAFSANLDGKRVPADFVVPDGLAKRELLQYLEDLFHEHATPTNGDVRRIG
ncbi:hypothetical protein [Pseudorhodoferax sp. Leaf265]|uniref:DUF7661 family protein n=1 Tax=Pseudorhodoferax sp. Leaf265 TaxID=1736315 RepID=UPI0006FEADA1|nr:hypothetical protein [Pseudorhodoferax sp. Leaf265]KQP03719.1 hypothetical protein ASF45_15160 [Pseudorhodoferax sp. Leaf265]